MTKKNNALELLEQCDTKEEFLRRIYPFDMFQMLFGEEFNTPNAKVHYDFHEKLNKHCANRTKPDYGKVAIALPRGVGKTSNIYLRVLRSLAYCEEKYIVVISKSAKKAKEFILRVRSSIERNHTFRKLFNIELQKANTEEIVVKIGNKYIRLQAYGIGSQIEGINAPETGARPTLFILDDVETAEIRSSEALRESIRQKFGRAVMLAGQENEVLENEGTVYVVIGTIKHEDSLLQRLIDSPQWDSMVYAIEDKGKLLWAEKWSLEKIRAKKQEYIDTYGKNEGLEIFYMEMYNEPNPIERNNLKVNNLIPYYKTELLKNKNKYKIFITCDGAVSKRRTADTTAIACVAIDEKNDWYLLEIDSGHYDLNEKRERFDRMVEKYSVRYTGVEFKFGGIELYRALKRNQNSENRQRILNGHTYEVSKLSPQGRAKNDRINGLSPIINNDKMYIPQPTADEEFEEDWVTAFRKEMRNYNPDKDNKMDNMLDAVAYVNDMIDIWGGIGNNFQGRYKNFDEEISNTLSQYEYLIGG